MASSVLGEKKVYFLAQPGNITIADFLILIASALASFP